MRLWDAADQFRVNSSLKAQEYSGLILGLIFLRFAAQRANLEKAGASSHRGSRVDEPAAYHADNVYYLATEAADIGRKVNAALREIEKQNPQLVGVLPKTYNFLTGALLKELLKKISEIPATPDFDAFGCILDPSCGSGCMFVQSARFVTEHHQKPAAELAICGIEKTDETSRLRLNIVVHRLEGDIRHGSNVNSYYDDPHAASGQIDFVLANLPFNENVVDKVRLREIVDCEKVSANTLRLNMAQEVKAVVAAEVLRVIQVDAGQQSDALVVKVLALCTSRRVSNQESIAS